MLKRLIEVALPLKEVSEQSAREKSIRHGHISTLHIWWARRPLAACRAVVFASLIPDPDDPECPDSFRTLVNDLLPLTPNGEDTPRNRCLEFIKHLVKWENSNNEDLVGKARKLIAAAHKFLHPDADGEMPKVLDPFAGGGAIPLEALRLGCEAHAIDINPVAHLIELYTLVYPQKYGQPNTRPTPDYIKRLEAAYEGKDGDGLFSKNDAKGKASGAAEIDGIALSRLPLITEAEYQKNPLAADVKFWGHWVLERAGDEIGLFYPSDPDGSIPVAYLWARTVKCPNPACGATIPLVRQYKLSKTSDRLVAVRLKPIKELKRCQFTIAENSAIDFDTENGTIQRGHAVCPLCKQTADVGYLRQEAQADRMREQLMAVVLVKDGQQGKIYREVADDDLIVFSSASEALCTFSREAGIAVPSEPISKNARGQISPPIYGLDSWGKLFNKRQALSMLVFCRQVSVARDAIQNLHDRDHAGAVGSFLALCVGRTADFMSSLCTFNFTGGRGVKNTFSRQALPMVWDYAESNPLNLRGANWAGSVDASVQMIRQTFMSASACARRASAARLPLEDSVLSAVITDPPYYDAVPYSDLSDYFYVWLKIASGGQPLSVFQTPLTPKREEIIQAAQRHEGDRQFAAKWYEEQMGHAFSEMHRTLVADGPCGVMFAHKEMVAWETLISALLSAGLAVTASWPIKTERPGRMRSQGNASLASSVLLVCRKRSATAGDGYWDDVRDELRQVARERLDFFWQQGIRGADFFISAIGPALSVYGRYAKVTRLTGEEVSVGQFLEEVRGVVTDYALSQILHGAKTGQIDPETRFYVLWKWSYADAKVPADEAFKLAQALGIDTEMMWDRTGVLDKQGQNVQALPITGRMRIEDLGEPNADGSPATIIDVLHRCCAFRNKGDAAGLAEFLASSGHGRNDRLWVVAQAISEVIPDGDKEKQLLQGLLNQRDSVEQAMEQGELF